MLEKKDLEMIAEIMEDALKPVKSDISELKTEQINMKNEMADFRTKLTVIKSEMADMKSEMSSFKTELTGFKSKMSGFETELTGTTALTKQLSEQVKELQITLENETNKNIQIIAEGHLDLNRKLDEALKNAKNNEMLNLRVSHLETDVRRLKNKVGLIG